MQGISRAVRSCQEILKSAILQHSRGGEVARLEKIVSRLKWVASPPAQEKGLENVTVADVLATKGNEETGPGLWCHTNDAVIDAVKNVRSYHPSVHIKFIPYSCLYYICA